MGGSLSVTLSMPPRAPTPKPKKPSVRTEEARVLRVADPYSMIWVLDG